MYTIGMLRDDLCNIYDEWYLITSVWDLDRDDDEWSYTI